VVRCGRRTGRRTGPPLRRHRVERTGTAADDEDAPTPRKWAAIVTTDEPVDRKKFGRQVDPADQLATDIFDDVRKILTNDRTDCRAASLASIFDLKPGTPGHAVCIGAVAVAEQLANLCDVGNLDEDLCDVNLQAHIVAYALAHLFCEDDQ